ncbi:Nucleoside diphosphate kinase 1 [Micractinium conductrix]|uniref:Nucleoside diphosphate kinase n=1 Tax=Micractinium conductrix TaxID=554055 RepID=A0A2P6VQZ2_9CHLO|nr:Nucleoside diphosphate kinase 1 [Micractinium conductrix]|eukprot:PSC76518.1 Nucleoside diphosphate kinase 1 [Micractinium conductrix]
METTFVMIKPDGVQRGLVTKILERFLAKGYTLRGLKMMNVSKQLAETHYSDLSAKPFFGGLVEYICSGPVVAIVLEGKAAVSQGRALIGATNPLVSAPGTIRGDFCIEVGRNIVHGSDSVESAQREIGLWFPEGLVDHTPVAQPWIYE